MLPVHKYVDMEADTFKQAFDTRGDYGIWGVMDADAKMMVVAEFMADTVRDVLKEVLEADVKVITKAAEEVVAKEVSDGGSNIKSVETV